MMMATMKHVISTSHNNQPVCKCEDGLYLLYKVFKVEGQYLPFILKSARRNL